MTARCWAPCGPCAVLLAVLLGSVSADGAKKELPHAAAHKQIVYRYIPIDKSFLSLDRAYDKYYKTSPISENARRDYGQTGYSGRLDSYDQLYNNDYRLRNDYNDYYDHHTGTGSKGEVDTYSSYSRGDSHHHGLSNSRRNSYDSSEYYDYDYSQDYSSTERPQRRHKVKKRQKKKTMTTRVLDFTEAMIRRMWSPRDSGGGHGHSHKGRHKKKKTRRPRFKWPRFISFDAVMRFLSYLFAIGAVVGYILLLTVNAVASDWANSVFNRSLDPGHAELVNVEALRLLRLLDAAVVRYQDGGCVLCRGGRNAGTESATEERPEVQPVTEE